MSLPPNLILEVTPRFVEHQALAAVKSYWEGKRGGRPMPTRADIQPSELKQWLPQILLADVLPADFRYRLVGSRLRPHFASEATGQLMSHALAPFGQETVSATLDVYRMVVIERAPVRIKGPGDWFAQKSKFFEAILMPLADDRANVNMIFGAFEFDWKGVPTWLE